MADELDDIAGRIVAVTGESVPTVEIEHSVVSGLIRKKRRALC
jgi:hypothetical protein